MSTRKRDYFLLAVFLLGERFTVLRATGDFLGETEEVRFLFGEAAFLTPFTAFFGLFATFLPLTGDLDFLAAPTFLALGETAAFLAPTARALGEATTAGGAGVGTTGASTSAALLTTFFLLTGDLAFFLLGDFLAPTLPAFLATLGFFTPATLFVEGDFLAPTRPVFFATTA